MPAASNRHVCNPFYMPAGHGAPLNHQDIQGARGFQENHLQIPQDRETPYRGRLRRTPQATRSTVVRNQPPPSPSHAATPHLRPAITDSIQRPNPRQQHPPSQQAAPWRAVPNRNHKPASNHEPAFVTSFEAAITYHAIETRQTRLQPAVFRLYCNR